MKPGVRGIGLVVLGDIMKSDLEDDRNCDEIVPVQDQRLDPLVALDRLLRYAQIEALQLNREVSASLIEAAIMSLPNTGTLSKH
jgi:hypothetical protein